jgi:hypothetical protein
MIAQHMRFTAGRAADRRLFRARWRLDGLPPSELLGLMRDSAVVSGWARRDGRLKKAFAEDPSGHKSLESDGDPAEVCSRASVPTVGEVGAAIFWDFSTVCHVPRVARDQAAPLPRKPEGAFASLQLKSALPFR